MRIVSLLLLVLIGAASADLATTPISRMQTGWWKQRFEEKQRVLREQPVNVVWLGDSITQDWERNGPQPWLRFKPIWDRLYAPLGSVNLGFKGDSTCHLLWRITHGELDFIRPKAIVLLIGANNFGRIHTPADETYAGILRLLSVIHGKLPETRVVLIGVLPSIRSAWVDANTSALNRMLRAGVAPLAYVKFIDVGGIFLKSGKVDPDEFIDPHLTPPEPALHPTAQAQEQLAAAIAPALRTALDGRPF